MDDIQEDTEEKYLSELISSLHAKIFHNLTSNP